MKLQLESKLLTEVAYDVDTLTLTATYRRGGTYTYQNVPASVADELQTAHDEGESVGSLFLTIVRNAGFTFTKVA